MNINSVLLELGLKPNLIGFNNIVDAVQYIVNNRSASLQTVYKFIADKNDSNSLRVERNIRHALETAWKDTRFEKLKAVGFHISNKPSIKEFIFMLAMLMVQNEK